MEDDIIPSEKLQDIQKILSNYEVFVYTNKDKDYDWLSSGHYSIKVKNKSNGPDMYIDLEDEISVFFGDWHNHYYPSEEYYENAKTIILDILNNKTSTINLYINEKWIGSKLNDKNINEELAINEVNNFFKNDDYFKTKMKENGVTLICKFWDSKKDKKFKIERDYIN